jgi:DNA-binding transcriptional ArsR family regulator
MPERYVRQDASGVGFFLVDAIEVPRQANLVVRRHRSQDNHKRLFEHILRPLDHTLWYFRPSILAPEFKVNRTLDVVFGSRSAAQALLFLQNYGEGHARRIAATFGVSPTAIQRQLRRLEAEGILVSRMTGNTRVFTWNPASPTATDLRHLLEAELERLPSEVTQQYFRQRQRPRRAGKPIQP